MLPTIQWRKTLLFFCTVCFILASCKDKDDKKEDAKQDLSEKTGPVSEILTTGSLDTLFIERQAFDTIGNGSKLVFSFTFKNTDTLTLHGWVQKQGNKFDSLPNIKLKNLRAGGLTYGVNKYFGNIILTPSEYNKIKVALIPQMNFVLFAPFLSGNNIAYRVFVSDKIKGEKEQILVINPTGAVANPSPPKVD